MRQRKISYPSDKNLRESIGNVTGFLRFDIGNLIEQIENEIVVF